MSFSIRGNIPAMRGLQSVQTFDKRVVNPDACVFVVIQPGAAQVFVIECESQRANQVQLRAGIGAQADDVAGVGGYLRLVEDDVEHEEITQNACQYREKRLISACAAKA
jgi:hypothetical protein